MNFKRFPLGALWTNGYLFWDVNGEAFFVDPGGDAHEVIDYMKEHSLTLRKVLLTHGHIDHIGGVHDMQPLVGDEIYIGSGDAGLLRTPPESLQQALGIRCEPTDNFKEVSEGMTINVGSFEIKVMETPGHTEGGVCYLIKNGDETVISVGDTLFAQSVGRTDLDGGDQAKLDDSLRRLAELPDELRVLPGHGPDTTIGAERKRNPFWPE